MAIGDAPKSERPKVSMEKEVEKDPLAYLDALAKVLAKIDASDLSDKEVEEAFGNLTELSTKGAEKLTRPVTQYVLKFFLSKGLEAEMISDNEIEVPDGVYTDDELYRYLKAKFPKASARNTGIIGGPTHTILVQYSMHPKILK